ncbi:hypothetical protein MLPF_0538 [Mycobacterium lepromatosis]|nr:hypothetical protein MLPF_0538 [Mycobacterium lepromatosis]
MTQNVTLDLGRIGLSIWVEAIESCFGVIMIAKRHVEVFVAGYPVCEPTVCLMQELGRRDCEVIVHIL